MSKTKTYYHDEITEAYFGQKETADNIQDMFCRQVQEWQRQLDFEEMEQDLAREREYEKEQAILRAFDKKYSHGMTKGGQVLKTWGAIERETKKQEEATYEDR